MGIGDWGLWIVGWAPDPIPTPPTPNPQSPIPNPQSNDVYNNTYLIILISLFKNN